jgi:hypothetical protein
LDKVEITWVMHVFAMRRDFIKEIQIDFPPDGLIATLTKFEITASNQAF